MKTHDLLASALAHAGLSKLFHRPEAAANAFACRLSTRTDGAVADLSFAAFDIGVPRVHMRLLLPENLRQADLVALYEEVSDLSARGYRCDFSRAADGKRVEVRSHVFIGVEDEESGLAIVANAAGLGRWLRVSVSASRKLLGALAGEAA